LTTAITIWTAAGAILTEIGPVMLTVALPDLVLSATEVAVTLT